MEQNSSTSQYEIFNPRFGDGVNVALKHEGQSLCVGLVSAKDDAAERVENIKEFGRSKSNYKVLKMDMEDSFYFVLSINGSMSRSDILAMSDMFDTKDEVEQLIEVVMQASQTATVVDSSDS